MTTAAIYCRVSTDNQENEGTSLQTQLEACQKYCSDNGHEIAFSFRESYSGLTLDRPKLLELREYIRNEQIDVLVMYCLDRLSRDPTHGVIITQELEKHGVKLEAVTEDTDNTEMGKLINYIRGFASKLEAEKIRERTMRGRKAKAIQGSVSSGGYKFLYGYDYICKSNDGGGRRVINNAEAEWVKKIFHWLVEDGLSTYQITDRLRNLCVPTKHKKMWCHAAVRNIIKNPAYIGRTYAYSSKKDFNEWIELANDITPAIIPTELFNAAQNQLRANKTKSKRNTKRQYLLRGHLRCKQCGRAYYGRTSRDRINKQRVTDRRYCCSGKLKIVVHDNQCKNRSWQADKLETLVWNEVKRYLSNRDLIVTEFRKQQDGGKKVIAFHS